MHLVHPPKFCITHYFTFLLGITVIPRSIKDNGYAKFWAVNKVHYGLWENGDFSRNEVEYDFESRDIVLVSA